MSPCRLIVGVPETCGVRVTPKSAEVKIVTNVFHGHVPPKLRGGISNVVQIGAGPGFTGVPGDRSVPKVLPVKGLQYEPMPHLRLCGDVSRVRPSLSKNGTSNAITQNADAVGNSVNKKVMI